MPLENGLDQNYPNPFSQRTAIVYRIEEPAHVDLTVYDVEGRVVRNLVNAVQPAGRHERIIELDDLPNGVYFYRMVTKDFTATRRMVVIN